MSGAAADGQAAPRRRRIGRPRRSAAGTGDMQSRERLLSVALRIFAENGYDAVSTNDIARAADLSQSMVHYHFGSKERLWKEAVRHLMRSLGARFPLAGPDLADLDPLSRLKVITRRFILMSAHDPTLSQLIVHEGTARSARLHWLVETYVRRGFREFDAALEEAIARGQVKALPVADMANAIVSASAFTFSLKPLVAEVYGIDLDDPALIDRMGDTVIEMIFSGISTRARGNN